MSVTIGKTNHNELLSKIYLNSGINTRFLEIYINIKKELINKIDSGTFITFFFFSINSNLLFIHILHPLTKNVKITLSLLIYGIINLIIKKGVLK
jgi:hypothetical protein